MKFLRFFVIGILFGIIMTKSEAISWYRIQEMFRFQSFHMYGIIGSALAVGVLGVYLMKRYRTPAVDDAPIEFRDKTGSWVRYLGGGTIFGLGWALSGMCPGPMFTLVGAGFSVVLVVIASAMLGTFVYGLIRHRLPH